MLDTLVCPSEWMGVLRWARIQGTLGKKTVRFILGQVAISPAYKLVGSGSLESIHTVGSGILISLHFSGKANKVPVSNPVIFCFFLYETIWE